jgi:signal transduction histidine kinase
VARAFAQYGEQGDRGEHWNSSRQVAPELGGGALEWHKARIAYLEGVRADMARQLENGPSVQRPLLLFLFAASSLSRSHSLFPSPSALPLCTFFSIFFSERLDRRSEVEQLEDAAHQQLRAAQALLSREREQREHAEQAVHDEMAQEMSAANRAAIDALDRADEAAANCRALEIKVCFPILL